MTRKPTDLKARLALLIAAGRSIRSAARELGIDKNTAYGWSKSPQLQARVQKIRSRTDDRTIGQLTRIAEKATSVLEILLDDPSPQIRLSAAKLVLDRRHAFENEANHARQLEAFQKQLTAFASVANLQAPIDVEARPALEGPRPPTEHEETPEGGTTLSNADE
jgi:transposase-like protein